MNNANPIHNRFMRLALYVHKRQQRRRPWSCAARSRSRPTPRRARRSGQIQSWKVSALSCFPRSVNGRCGRTRRQ